MDRNKIDETYENIMREDENRLNTLKKEYKSKLKDLINTTGLWKHLDEMDGWEPMGIVETTETDEKSNGYSRYSHVRCSDDNHLYLVQNSEIRGVKHECVWQVTGYLEDDYFGYMLYPLNNGKYFKVSYNC